MKLLLDTKYFTVPRNRIAPQSSFSRAKKANASDNLKNFSSAGKANASDNAVDYPMRLTNYCVMCRRARLRSTAFLSVLSPCREYLSADFSVMPCRTAAAEKKL